MSGHGFGHLAQTAPVLAALAQQTPLEALTLCCALPARKIRYKLTLPHIHDSEPRDVGLIQTDPMQPDLPATAAALDALHADWPQKLAREREKMAAFRPDVVIANIPYLTLEAAQGLGIPTVALASLSWDRIVAGYYDVAEPRVAAWLQRMRVAYGGVDLALAPHPAMADAPFPHVVEIPPILDAAQPDRAGLRAQLGISPEETRPLILVSLGGIPIDALPFDLLRRERRGLFLIDHPDAPHEENLYNVGRLGDWPFGAVIGSVDGVVGKPGYGMSVECAAHGIPFLYARRFHFADEASICAWLAQHGRAREITLEQFFQADWWADFEAVLAQPTPPRPAHDGAQEAARRIRCFLQRE
ncbi:hypothetical protein MAIT1_00043 [Magnetofaba australis IT-1]|uniref:Uncharacterized protein n=1 Tax=Magnetofaba australis IT-1 TaxID=1434232 RepID=A0A1Y2K993_9PROT|nr:hypothetical protein MAIT1_00043 [Magnetofaba australis IT-1]